MLSWGVVPKGLLHEGSLLRRLEIRILLFKGLGQACFLSEMHGRVEYG